MKFVYVCSPLRGDIENNIKKAHEYNNYVIECGFMPLAPHVIFSKYFDDNIPERRELGLAMGLELLKRCDEIWVCGDTISKGMQGEIALARHLKIPTLYVDDALLLSQTPIRQEQEPLSSDDVIENSLNGVLRNKILVLNPDSVHGGSSDRSLWKCVDDKSVVGGYIDWLQMENLISGEKRSVWISEFLGVVKPESLSNWLINNPVHDDYTVTALESDMSYPAFNPKNYEVRRQMYGNTGGHCMVGTMEFYLPDIDRTVWVHCNDESVAVTTADTTWNEDNSDSWEHYEDYLLYKKTFENELPADVQQWFPIIKETLAYTIEQETAYFREGHTFSIPVNWLPDSIRIRADDDYLGWLHEAGEKISIGKGGLIVVDAEYSSPYEIDPDPFGLDEDEELEP